jgi:hypothetical protein
MNKKCYEKRFEYIVPILKCDLCNKEIKPGDKLYVVVLTWGNGKITCEKCYEEYEVEEEDI